MTGQVPEFKKISPAWRFHLMDNKIEVAFVLIIWWTALAFGGVEPFAYTVTEAGVFLIVFLLLWNQTRHGDIKLTLPIWPVLFWVWAAIALVPLPLSIVERLSPARASDSTSAGALLGKSVWKTLSASPHETEVALLKFAAYLAAFALGAYFFDSQKRNSVLVRGLIYLGCFEAVYGIIQYLTGWQKIFTYTKQFDVFEATGTYINRDHFAGCLELILPFVFAAAFYRFQVWSERHHDAASDSTSYARRSVLPQSCFYLFVMVILAIALIFSRSRGGILTATFAIVAMALMSQLMTRRKAWSITVFLFLACLVGYILWIGLDPVLARFEMMRDPNYLQLEGRVTIWKDALRLVREYPLTGTGLGTFKVVYRRYQTSLVNFFVDHAHNDYVEFASETGIPGLLVFWTPILCLFGKMISSFLDDPRRYRRSITLACIGSTLALLLHSVIDFNLQIPANALLFATVLGIGYKAACVERRAERERG